MRLSSYLALFGCLGGAYLLVRNQPSAAPTSARPALRSAKITLPVVIQSDTSDTPDTDFPEIQSDTSDERDEAIRGLELERPEELAMVFTVDGTTYLRLSQEERATSHGTRRMIESGDVTSVVATVGINALPAGFQKWAGRTVLVDGECRARVVGFAEVSRVSGEAGDYEYNEDGTTTLPAPWNIESVTASNVTLAAELDGCSGTWARAESESPAAIATLIEAPDLEDAALADFLAKTDDDETQAQWKADGGEGDWRDHANVSSVAWQHPLTNEHWVFVQAHEPGGCGDPGVSVMRAYRAGDDGRVRRAADLSYGYDTIQQVVDLDGDGQPELVMGAGERSDLVDLADKSHESIYVEHHSYGCGC